VSPSGAPREKPWGNLEYQTPAPLCQATSGQDNSVFLIIPPFPQGLEHESLRGLG
jgi:hypothetical protein